MFTTRDEPLAAPGRGRTRRCRRHADLRRVRVPRVPRRRAPSASGSARTSTTSACATRSSRRARVQTLDIVSGGRVEFGIGASWLEEEWVAAELDFATRGRRVDEAHRGLQAALDRGRRSRTTASSSRSTAWCSSRSRVQQPWPPILVGGESEAALRRAARLGDGWIGMSHDFESGAAQIDAAPRAARRAGPRRRRRSSICLGGPVESTRRRRSAGRSSA